MGASLKDKAKLSKPVLKSFNCPNCGATLEIVAVGSTVSVSCNSCLSIIDTKDENYRLLAKAVGKKRVQPAIPIGTRGKFSGKVYEVIGFMQRRDSGFYWREYLLFNPYHGFRWLTEIDGHWSYTKKINDIEDNSNMWSSNQKFKSKNFKLFNRGAAIVDYVEGEFYWRVKVGDHCKMYDFIAPPYMISKEVTKEEVSWSQSIYLERDRVAEIFKIKEDDLPWQQGVAANQPSDLKKKLKECFKYFLYTVAFCFLLNVLFLVIRDNKTVFDHNYKLKMDYASSTNVGKYKEIKTDEFQIDGDDKNIWVEVSSNVSNSWLFVDMVMVNKKTGETIPMPIEVSYYYGSDWSEGSRSTDRYEFNIPAGVYYILMEFQKGGNHITSQYVRVKLKSDVVIGGNFIWLIVFCLIPLILTALRSRSFEVQRWSNSSENPYEEE